MSNKKINHILLCGEYSGIIDEYKTLWDAYNGLKEVKNFDKKENIEETYYFLHEYEKNNNLYQIKMRIYKRNNKIFFNYIREE